jgi:predicted PurR-regulated permease PerM
MSQFARAAMPTRSLQVTDRTDEAIPPKLLGPNFVDAVIRIGCLALLVYWTAILIRPFLTIIVWSVILTVVLYPIFRWSTTRLGLHPVLAALLITSLSLVILLGPTTWLSLSLVASVRSSAERLATGEISIPPPPSGVKGWPVLGNRVFEIWELASTNLKAALLQIEPQLKPLSGTLLAFAGNAGISMLKFVAAVIFSGFLFVPGPSLASSARSALRHILTRRGDEFLNLAGTTVRNLARGVIGVALLQALLAGMGFLVAGVAAAGVLSLLVLLLGILQIGAFFVIGPLIIWSWMTMHTTAALAFSLYMVPVSLLDNFLRPFFMAHGLKTPMLVILLGVLGGILVHGIIGIFVGPVVLAIAWELLVAWTQEGAEKLEEFSPASGEQIEAASVRG